MTVQTASAELDWAIAVIQRGYSALHPTPELPRPGALQQAAAVREAFAPAAPLLAARALGRPVEPFTSVRSTDAAYWFTAEPGLAVAVVPPFQAPAVEDQVAGVALRLPAGVPVHAVVPAGAVRAFERLAAHPARPLALSSYRADLIPTSVSTACRAA